jgi:hypothetical protein
MLKSSGQIFTNFRRDRSALGGWVLSLLKISLPLRSYE